MIPSSLKWHYAMYAQFSLQNLSCTSYIFQMIAINNDKWQTKIQCYLLKLKNKNCQKNKKTAPLFLYFEGHMHLYLCIYLYFYAIILMKQYFKLITFYAHLLQNVRLFTYNLSSVVHSATLKSPCIINRKIYYIAFVHSVVLFCI